MQNDPSAGGRTVQSSSGRPHEPPGPRGSERGVCLARALLVQLLTAAPVAQMWKRLGRDTRHSERSAPSQGLHPTLNTGIGY